ncbi:ubiquitin--protein ligase [Ostertagia ostertagi]
MKFVSEIWHPNSESIFFNKEGNVCISPPPPPPFPFFTIQEMISAWGYERPEERWLPVHTVETILLSVISMLADPNFESPANVDAAKMQRENYSEFKKRVAACVRRSQEE